MRQLSTILICLALVRITGLDLAIAQMDAWVSMVSDRSTQGIEHALESIFSGKAPCEKCLSIKKEKQEREENSAETLHSLDKLKLPYLTARALPAPRYSAQKKTTFLPPIQFPSIFHMEVESPPPEVGS